MRRLAASFARAAVAAGLVVGVSLGGATLVEAVTSPAAQSAVVHGCYGEEDRLLRIVDPGVSCEGDIPLDWVRAGLDGPAGPPGAAGAMGATGPVGPAGRVGADGRPLAVERVSASARGAGRQVAQARCPSGRHALSGGWSAPGASAISVVEDGPTDGYRGWRVAAKRSGRWTLTVTALCQPAGTPPEPAAVPNVGAPRATCAVACVPATLTLADAVGRGVPIVLARRRGAFTAVVTLRANAQVVGRTVRRAGAATGVLKLTVPLTGRGARALAARRSTRLTARIRIRGRTVAARTLTVRR